LNNDLVWLFGIGKQAFIIRSHLERTKNLKEKNKKKCGQQATCSRKTMTAIAEKNSCTDGWRKVICGVSFTGSDKTGDLTLFKKAFYTSKLQNGQPIFQHVQIVSAEIFRVHSYLEICPTPNNSRDIFACWASATPPNTKQLV